MSAKLGIDFAKYFALELESLAELEADGLIRTGPRGLEVTNPGRLFVRNIAMKFDASQRRELKPQFSRTI